MSRKHRHRADNRPASRRYIARSLARLQQHLDSTIIQATALQGQAKDDRGVVWPVMPPMRQPIQRRAIG